MATLTCSRRGYLLAVAPLAAFALAACDSSTGPSVASCDPGDGVQLQVGDAVHYQGEAARIICVTAPGGGEYVLVAFAGNPSSGEGMGLAFRGANILGPAAAPSVAADGPEAHRGHFEDEGVLELRPDLESHHRLRQVERRELAHRVGTPSGVGAALPAPAILASVPEVGDLMTINTQTSSACSNPRYRGGEVKAVSERAIVVADTLNPGGSGTFTDSHYQHYAATFDTLVAPLDEANFGAHTDIDGNGRVILFFTQDVNRLSEPDSDIFTGGFFFARDLFPREEDGGRLQPCEHSNEAELLYLLVPDPDGEINGNERDLEFLERITVTTLTHELQHLINAARRLLIVESTDPFEEVWLNEGLSHIAEELLFYRVSGFGPGQNLGSSDFSGNQPAVDAYNRHQIANTFRLEEFLVRPDTTTPYNEQDLLSTRGAAWHFLRYALDRKGGTQATTLRQLVDSNSTGIQNLSGAFGNQTDPLFRWFSDWAVAVYADERVSGTEDRYRDRSWNHRSMFNALNQGSSSSYPLRIRSLENDLVLSESLKGGSAAYFRFAVQAGETGAVEISSGQNPPPPGLRVTLMRVE